MKEKKKGTKKKMSTIKKIVLSFLSVVALIAIAYLAYTTIHYRLYREYKNYLTKNDEYVAGTEFAPIADSNANVSGMVLAAENDTLKLYVNQKSAEVAVYDKRTGVTTYSNPPAAAQDGIASGINKSILQSQLVLDYYNTNRKSTTFNSFDYSTSKEQFKIESIPNGLRVVYTIGDLESKTGIAPIYISPERLASFTEKLSKKNASFVTLRYSEDSDIDGFLYLPEAVQTAPATMRKIIGYLEEAGYTKEDYEADMEAAGVGAEEQIYFVVPLEYTLNSDKLMVRVPTDHIEEYGGGMLYRMQLLRYMGASGVDQNGYMLVPNGAGSIINFNNGKSDATEYNRFVYNIDPVAAEYLVRENAEMVRMPLFGMYYEDTKTGLFAVIEKSESQASITADVSGKLNSYNYAYPTFQLRGSDTLSMFGTTGGEADLPIVEKELYTSDIVMSYSFLTEDYQGYSGMANYYRERLIADGTLSKLEKKSEIPFYMDLIGAVKMTNYFMGVQYLDVSPMTTFKQAQEIVDDLNAGGVNRLVVNYQGWFNEGYYHDAAKDISLDSEVGNKKQLKELAEKIEANGGRLYGDVAFTKLSYIADDFNYTREASRYYGAGYVVQFGQVSPVTLRQTASLGYEETLYNVVSPKFLPRYVDGFVDEVNDYALSGISLRDLADTLSSDKKRTEVIIRDQAQDIVEAQLEKLDTTGKKMMASGGNAYAWRYVDELINVPTSGNDYLIVDEDVPFFEMLLHGYVDYSGSAINLDDSFDQTDSILTMIEYGAAPHFTFTYNAASDMKYTGLNGFYSTTYKNKADTTTGATIYTWDELAKKVYADVNKALQYVTDATMVQHEILESGVAKVTYDNGVVIYVNNQDTDAEADGKMIAKKSYEVEGTGK